MIHLIYFAWVRERIGREEEALDLPHGVETVGALLDWLAYRGEEYGHALEDRTRLRVAVNQAYADDDTAVGEGDEVAIFPPVTGG